MAKLARRRKRFSGKLRAEYPKLRGFDREQRSHPKQHMPIPKKKLVKDPKVEAVLDKDSTWASS